MPSSDFKRAYSSGVGCTLHPAINSAIQYITHVCVCVCVCVCVYVCVSRKGRDWRGGEGFLKPEGKVHEETCAADLIRKTVNWRPKEQLALTPKWAGQNGETAAQVCSGKATMLGRKASSPPITV